MKRYFESLVRYSIVYLFLPLIFSVALALCEVVYFALSELFPAIFPVYNKVLEKESYEALAKFMSNFAVLLSVFAASFFSSIYNNGNYEHVIRKTDGLYKIKNELPQYLQRIAPGEIISAAVPPVIFTVLSVINYPEKFFSKIQAFLRPHLILVESFGAVGAYFLLLFTALLASLAAAPLALRRYRALWLSSFVDG